MAHDCSVFECESKRRFKGKNIKLYSFPSRPREINRRMEWIKFVQSTRPDGDDWEPQEYSKVCSAHFVGGKKSTVEISPAYNPTLYPGLYNQPPLTEEAEMEDLIIVNRKTIRKLNQKLRLEGKQYYGEKRTKNGVQLVVRDAREIGPPCTSPRCMQSKSSRFCRIFTEEDRKKIFDEFWNINNLNDRKNYTRKLIKVGVPKRRTCKTVTKLSRNVDYKYFLRKNGRKYQVCKDLFTSTLGMKNWKFQRWFKQDDELAAESDFTEEEISEIDENEDIIEIKEEPLVDPLDIGPISNQSYDDPQPSTSNIVRNQLETPQLMEHTDPLEILPIIPTQSSEDKEVWSKLINTAVMSKDEALKTHNDMSEPDNIDASGETLKMECDDEYKEQIEDDDQQDSNMGDFVQVQLQELDTENTYKCIHCPNTYPSQDTLNEHYITVKFCSICKTQVEDLYQHIITNHVIDENICEFCAEIIETDLENHMKIHAFVNEITCNNCNTKVNSTEHICQITKTCISCNITFETKQDLLIHTILQHFKSDRCKSCFRNISVIGLANLEMHVRYCKNKSIKKLPEICLKCNKEFINVNILLEHHKKDHECIVHCSEVFDRRNDLIDHLINNAHKVPSLVCKFCFISFEDRQLFVCHMVKHKMKRNKYK